MKSTERECVRLATQWLVFADEDLRLAQHALTLSAGVPYRLVAYHAQQCAEKYLKAYLVYRSLDFPFTHNLGYLLGIILKNTDWKIDLDEAKDLTPFAITARYPGLFDEVSSDDARNAIHIALTVRGAVRGRLAEEGFSFPV